MNLSKTLISALGLLAFVGCGGVEAPSSNAHAVAVSAEAFDVDVEGIEATLYARIQIDGRADFAMQLASGEWREGQARFVDPLGDITLSRPAEVESLGGRLYEALTAEAAAPSTQRHAYYAVCTDAEKKEKSCEAPDNNPFVVLTSLPERSVIAEPHRDSAEPHDETEAEPHLKAPEAEPHGPLGAAEPH